MTPDWVPPEHREIHEFLQHWGRWLRTRPAKGHCASIEHRYRSPQCWDERNPRPPEPELGKAILIEELMRIVPRLARKILKLAYVYHADGQFIARRLRLKDFDSALY